MAPAYEPAEHDEITSLLRYVGQQLDALRASAYGLTEAQSRETPRRSSLSIAGLIKHALYVMRGGVAPLTGAEQTEELACHAGHADIIREQIDGMSIPALVLTLEGAPANNFFQPYVPAPGTIGATLRVTLRRAQPKLPNSAGTAQLA